MNQPFLQMADSSYEPALGPYRGDMMVEGHKTGGHCQPTNAVPSKGSLKVQDFRTSKPKINPPCTSCKQRRIRCDRGLPSCKACSRLHKTCSYAPPLEPWERIAPQGQTKHNVPASPYVFDMLHKFDLLRAVRDPARNTSETQQYESPPDISDTPRPSQPRKIIGHCQPSPQKPKRLLEYDVWKTSTSPIDIPNASPTTGAGTVLLSTSLPESVDAYLSRSLEQCEINEQLDDACPKSNDPSWISRWWPITGCSNDASLSACETETSSVDQSPATSESHLSDDKPLNWGQGFFNQKRSYVSALSAMLGKCPSPQPLCPPKHDIWAVIATARKIQPTLSKLACCSGPGHRKAQSCPTPRMQRALGEAALSPSSASQPRAIPCPKSQDLKDPMAPKTTLSCAASGDESMDTSYTSGISDPVTNSCTSFSSPGLVSRDEQKNILLGRLMDYFFEVMANNHKSCNGGSSSTTGSSSAKPVTSMSTVMSGARRGFSRKGKRSASSEDEGSGDEENESPKAKKVKTDETEVKRLACPFFKRNPHKYKDRGTCIGPGWTTVHRLKEHLYRRHSLQPYCLRCHDIFPDEASLEQHSQSQDPCQRVVGAKTLEGITSSQEKQLRSRKRSDKTEEEKWRDVYRICFPLRDDEDPTPIPSPYFELPTPGEGGGGPGQASDMARYDEYMSRELPRRVKRALELRIDQEFSPVEESLKRQLPDIVRGLYQTLSEDFRRTLKASPPRQEVMGKDQELDDSTEPRIGGGGGGGDSKSKGKGKGKTVASDTPEPPMEEISDSPSDCVVDETPNYNNWAASQPIDLCRQLQPYLGGSLAGLDSWMCGVGQDARYGDWPESGYFPEAMTGASSIMMSNNDCNMFSNESLALQAPYIGENGVYQDRFSLT